MAALATNKSHFGKRPAWVGKILAIVAIISKINRKRGGVKHIPTPLIGKIIRWYFHEMNSLLHEALLATKNVQNAAIVRRKDWHIKAKSPQFNVNINRDANGGDKGGGSSN